MNQLVILLSATLSVAASGADEARIPSSAANEWVTLGGCNDCHTNPPYAAGGDPFAGEPEQINIPCYLSGGTTFGPFTSRNLTPDSNGLPAGLTLEEFIHVLRTGEDTTSPFNPPFDGGLLQVMPWPVYGKMTDRDLKAIYEYLSAIPSRPRCLTPPS